MNLAVVRMVRRAGEAAMLSWCVATPAGAQTDPGLVREDPGMGIGVGYTGNGGATRDGQRVRLTRGPLRSFMPSFPSGSSPAGVDVFGGVGLYDYGLPAAPAKDDEHGGLHGGVAFDYARQHHRVAWGAELRIQAVGGPGSPSPVGSDILLVAAGALTARITFP